MMVCWRKRQAGSGTINWGVLLLPLSLQGMLHQLLL
jgi:hypothetical protein